ncbi:hypothetical protein COY43_03030 [Candidatus Berkelbacteria bacterium CG_4_10_14_0_8_um_filter_35_9_33_8]|nr:MAG: hypothetical protein COY43_03030 [Candidatus Berkelbacteria bacterium CG_4_10_14_0_8_um_filter_35_9_33_8]
MCLSEESERIHIVLENQSKNTAQNIYNGISRIIVRDVDPNKIIYVICDKFRKIKVKILVYQIKKLFLNTGKIKIIGFKRKDIHPHSNYFYQFFTGLRYLSFHKFAEDMSIKAKNKNPA